MQRSPSGGQRANELGRRHVEADASCGNAAVEHVATSVRAEALGADESEPIPIAGAQPVERSDDAVRGLGSGRLVPRR